ncbi:MAG: PAS domain-containing protein, partial [Limnobacter sp.]|nr:PAS domain-containing protein [Limnobacter sp.]
TEQKLQTLAASSKIEAINRSQGVIEFDPHGNIVWANENFLSLTGYSLEEVRGRHHRLFMDPDEAKTPAYKQFWEKLGSGHFDSGQYLRYSKHGDSIWIQATYNPIIDDTGKVLGVIKFAQDISEQKLKSLEVEGQMDAVSKSNCIIEFNKNAEIIGVNDKVLDTLLYKESQIVGQERDVLFFEDDEETHEQIRKRWAQLTEGKTVQGEFCMKAADGSEAWLQGSCSPVMDLKGQLYKVFMVAQNITREKNEALESKAKLGAIDRAQAVIEFNLNGEVLEANQNFLELMEYSLEQIKGRHHRIFVDPEYATTMEYQAFWEQLGRGQFLTGEYKRIGRLGREVWIQATYNPVYDSRGKLAKVVKFAIDVTESKLRASEFEAKVDAINLGQAVIEFDLDGKVLSANRNFLKAMGYTLREIQGQHHSIFCTLKYAQSEEYRDFWLRLGEGESTSGRFHRVGKFNRDVWIQATYSPIYDLNGKVMKVVKYA